VSDTPLFTDADLSERARRAGRRMPVKCDLYGIAVRTDRLTDDELDVLETAIAAGRGAP
jgi:hypothetical protein